MEPFRPSPAPTVGVEQEFHLIDAETADLASRVDEVRAALPQASGSFVDRELFLSVLEGKTPVCESVAEVGDRVRSQRQELSGICRRLGLRLAAAGTHPFARWQDQQFVPSPHYQWARQMHGFLIHQMLAFGLHVHIGMPGAACAIYVLKEMQRWIYPLLALSASSPYSSGMDTGLDSARMHLFRMLPRTGLPPELDSMQEWELLYEKLADGGDITEPNSLWWLLRPQPKFGTVELRVFDLPADQRRLEALTAITQAAAVHYRDRFENSVSLTPLNRAFLHENEWKAMRFGLAGTLIDPATGDILPVSEQLTRLLDRITPAAERLGTLAFLEVAREMLKTGNEATRMRQWVHDHDATLRDLELEIARLTVR